MVQENQLHQEYNEVSELEKEIFNEIKLILRKIIELMKLQNLPLGRSLARLQRDNTDLITCLRMIIDSFVDETIFSQELLD